MEVDALQMELVLSRFMLDALAPVGVLHVSGRGSGSWVTADVPVIFLSGLGGDRYVAKAFEMGAADYVVKPFSPTELLARISAALRRRALSRHADIGYRIGPAPA